MMWLILSRDPRKGNLVLFVVLQTSMHLMGPGARSPALYLKILLVPYIVCGTGDCPARAFNVRLYDKNLFQMSMFEISKGSGETAQMRTTKAQISLRNLISAFVVCCLDSIIHLHVLARSKISRP